LKAGHCLLHLVFNVAILVAGHVGYEQLGLVASGSQIGCGAKSPAATDALAARRDVYR
jgi:hypothetical protein